MDRRCRARPCREVLQERSSEVGGRFLEKYLNLCGDSETVEEITVDVRGPGRKKRGKTNPSMPMYYTQKGKKSGGSGGGSGGCPGSLEDCIAACPAEVRVFKVCSANCGKRCKKK